MEINIINGVHNVPPYRGGGHYGLGPVTKKSRFGSFGLFGHARSQVVLAGNLAPGRPALCRVQTVFRYSKAPFDE